MSAIGANDGFGTTGNFASGAATGAAVGGVPGAVVGGVLGLASSMLGSNAADDAAELAYKRQKDMYQNRHQWTVQDLIKAGLNPALAYGQGGGATGAFPTVAQSNSGEIMSRGGQGLAAALGSTANSAAMVRLAEKRSDAEIRLLESQAVKAQQDTATSAASAAQYSANTRLLEESLPKLQQEIRNLSADEGIKRLQANLMTWDIKSAPATYEAKQYAVKQALADIALKAAQSFNQYEQGKAAGLGMATTINGIAKIAGQFDIPLNVMEPIVRALTTLPRARKSLEHRLDEGVRSLFKFFTIPEKYTP